MNVLYPISKKIRGMILLEKALTFFFVILRLIIGL
jgi:hypothetical protein